MSIFNSDKNYEQYFEFCQIDPYNKIYQQKVIYLVNLILFLHINVKDIIITKLRDHDFDFGGIVDVLKEFDLGDSDKLMKISKAAIMISYHYNFQVENIFHGLYNVLRFRSNLFQDRIETILSFIKDENHFMKIESGQSEMNRFYYNLERDSFCDYIDRSYVYVTNLENSNG
jgi:hypothetical protein